MTLDTYSEDYRLDCLARFWIGRPRANAAKWLEEQTRKKPAFAAVMREKMNAEKIKRKESRAMAKPAAQPKPKPEPIVAQAVATDAPRRDDAPSGRTMLDEMLAGFR